MKLSINKLGGLLDKTAPRLDCPPIFEARESLLEISIAKNILNWNL